MPCGQGWVTNKTLTFADQGFRDARLLVKALVACGFARDLMEIGPDTITVPKKLFGGYDDIRFVRRGKTWEMEISRFDTLRSYSAQFPNGPVVGITTQYSLAFVKTLASELDDEVSSRKTVGNVMKITIGG